MIPDVYLFRRGPLEVTVSRHGAAWRADVYHAGDAVLRPRFVCTGEEGVVLGWLARASSELIEHYLARGLGFDRWCRDRGLDPAHPDLADPPDGHDASPPGRPLRAIRGRCASRE